MDQMKSKTHEERKLNLSMQSDSISYPEGIRSQVGGVLTDVTMKQNHVIGYDTSNKEQPNIFYNSLGDKDRKLLAYDFDAIKPESEEKLMRLLYRKRFRMKA